MVQDSIEARRAAKGGVISGFLAGALLTVMMTVMSAANRSDVWYGMKGAAAPFLARRAMAPGFDLPAVLFGLGTHLAISIAWAVPFALLAYGLSRGATLAASVAWGIVVWLGMYWIVLPMAGLANMTIEAPIGRVVGYHVFFGLAVGAAFLLFQRARGTTGTQRHLPAPWSSEARTSSSPAPTRASVA